MPFNIRGEYIKPPKGPSKKECERVGKLNHEYFRKMDEKAARKQRRAQTGPRGRR
jgi:hypothetical protein